MNQVLESLRYFIVRDITYVVGGSSVIVASYFDHPSFPRDSSSIWLAAPVWMVLLLLGTAYGLGYIIQEMLSIVRIITTSHIVHLPRGLSWAYRRFTGLIWKDLDLAELKRRDRLFLEGASDRVITEYHRIINLKQISTTLGTNWLVCSFILVAKDHSIMTNAPVPFLVSCALILNSWIKGAQQSVFVWNWGSPELDRARSQRKKKSRKRS